MKKLILAVDWTDPRGIKAKLDPHGLPVYRCQVCAKETSNAAMVVYDDCHYKSVVLGYIFKLFRVIFTRYGF